MLSHSYVIPSVTSLPPGYDCVVFSCRKQLTERLLHLPGTIVRRARAFCDGQLIFSQDDEITLGPGAISCDGIVPIRISRPQDAMPAYIEVDYFEPSSKSIFRSNGPLAEYVVFSAPGRKSFFSDSAYKYASPPTIAQIAKFGAFCEGYPVVVLDRVRGYAESLIVINPYLKSLSCSIRGSDQRAIPVVRVRPQSAEYVDLTLLMKPTETRWQGRIQLEAKNRVIAFNIKHRWGDRGSISDHEHFDSFRADPTHMALSLKARFMVGRYLSHRGVNLPA